MQKERAHHYLASLTTHGEKDQSTCILQDTSFLPTPHQHYDLYTEKVIVLCHTLEDMLNNWQMQMSPECKRTHVTVCEHEGHL